VEKSWGDETCKRLKWLMRVHLAYEKQIDEVNHHNTVSFHLYNWMAVIILSLGTKPNCTVQQRRRASLCKSI